MDDSFGYNWRSRIRGAESFFSPGRKNRTVEPIASPPTRFIDYGDGPAPSSSKTASVMDTLYFAIESQDADTVAQILFDERDFVVDVNQVMPEYPMSLLHLAVGFSKNDPQIIELLMRCDGDPNNKNIEEGLSPLHLSVIYDFDKVMAVLISYGGDPEICTKDGQNCYDIVKRNVEEELAENCFSYFFKQSSNFRKSMGPTPKMARSNHYDSGNDGLCSSDSQILNDQSLAPVQSSDTEGIHGIAKRLFPQDYQYLMTEDESANDTINGDSDEDDFKKKLTTIAEESGIGASPVSVQKSPSFLSPLQAMKLRGMRGIASMTAPQCLLTDDETQSYYSLSSDSSSKSSTTISCVNSTPPITPQPTMADLEKLKEQMKQLRLPVTPSTYGVISKFAKTESGLENLMTPKAGTINFSSELQAGIQDLNLIHEWGKHKIDYLQNATPTAKTSKSFYNYLLLDPKIIKRINFSGDHLKASIINSSEKFEKFLSSVFYIGKAHGKRPLQHLVEAKKKYLEMGKKQLKNGEKIDKILEVWRRGMGVMIVSVFHHSSEREANVNEACMIDAMGLVELSNIKKGSYTGTIASSWSQKVKNQLGSLLLYKAFCSFVVSDPKQFYPQDF